jgi:hypothetical protein
MIGRAFFPWWLRTLLLLQCTYTLGPFLLQKEGTSRLYLYYSIGLPTTDLQHVAAMLLSGEPASRSLSGAPLGRLIDEPALGNSVCSARQASKPNTPHCIVWPVWLAVVN